MGSLYPKDGFSLAQKLFTTLGIIVLGWMALKYKMIQTVWSEGLLGKVALISAVLAYAYTLVVMWGPKKLGKVLMKT